MKYPVFAILIATLLAFTPVSAEEKGVVSATTTDTKKTPKTETTVVKKQKIEEGFSLTVQQLSLVITRTQTAIDLLTKNGKDTTDAQEALTQSRQALEKAQAALDDLSVAPTENDKKDTVALLKTTASLKTVPTFKDQVKKIQDTLKESRSALIESISALKESLTPKEVTPEQ